MLGAIIWISVGLLLGMIGALLPVIGIPLIIVSMICMFIGGIKLFLAFFGRKKHKINNPATLKPTHQARKRGGGSGTL